ncbi:aspartate 1-decarboxylase [Dyella tabacisoli]|uniref:Aspartate 1-decarboxylase n=2 Tax=Dyella tabacisoli TaxID=2282381 RepID=A0A369UQ46_9GAMM|nr:aspartate 1-decarboxylase [Dyella tabacisoli]
MMIAKLHGIRVTGAELHYEGSIAIDPRYCDRAGLLPLQFVEVWNKSSGARISTYIIHGEPGSQCCVLNGAAARTCQVGDELIIAARAEINADALEHIRSRVLLFDENNRVTEMLEYGLRCGAGGLWRAVRLPEERTHVVP